MRGIFENMKENVVYHRENIWIIKISVLYCSAMVEMHSSVRNPCSRLQLRILCREFFHCGGCDHHHFPSPLSCHTLHCPSNVRGLFMSPGRFLFCLGVLPQEAVFRPCRVSGVDVGWEMHWDSASCSFTLNQTWGTWSWALLCPCWHPRTGVNRSILLCCPMTQSWGNISSPYVFHCNDQSRPVCSSIILMQDCRQRS